MIGKATDFREKVRARYDQAMAQIEPIIELAVRSARAADDPGDIGEIQKVLETVVGVYTAKCGPLNAGSAAWLMLKAIRETLNQEQESVRKDLGGSCGDRISSPI